MSKKELGKKAKSYTLAGTAWANAWKTCAGAGALGMVASLAGMFVDAKRFGFSYLFAFVVFLTAALGSLFFILINRLTSAGWSVTVRRVAEFFSAGLLVFPILFIPIVLSMGNLYPWLSHGEHGEHAASSTAALVPEAQAAQHGAPGSTPHAPPALRAHPGADARAEQGDASEEANHIAHGNVLASKKAFLNKPFFLVRAAIYFAIWCWLGWTFLKLSTRQDTTGDPKDTVAAQRIAHPAAFLFGVSLTFAMVDWVMSLEPSWFSTIFGVYLFAGSTVGGFAVLTFTLISLKETGPLKEMVNVEHLHDMGNLLFGFTSFWAYIAFSQYMLIWYAALPEETTYYHARGMGPAGGSWQTVSIGLIVLHFVVPFLMLISRQAKRRLGILKFGAAWLFVIHIADIYWFVLPNLTKEITPHWLDFTCLLGVGGLYLAAVFYFMSKHQLIPVSDPRLKRALTFEQV